MMGSQAGLAAKPLPTARICLIGAAVSLVLILALAWLFERGKRTVAVRSANGQVARRIQVARSLLADREWDRAIDYLQATMTVERATALEQVRELLVEAQQAQAQSILEAAAAAVEKDNFGHAIQLLQAYLTHPQATNKARAALLLVETGRRDKAGAFRQVAETQQMQDQQRQKVQDERIVRMQTTPVFRELQEFVALVRKQDKRNREVLAKEDRETVASLLQAQKVGKRTRAGVIPDALRQRPDDNEAAMLAARWKDSLEEAISVKRANFKERFRAYQEFEKADWEPFDCLVDKELDQLVDAIHKPFEDDVAVGLRALAGK
jgi:hypothetical protein